MSRGPFIFTHIGFWRLRDAAFAGPDSFRIRNGGIVFTVPGQIYMYNLLYETVTDDQNPPSSVSSDDLVPLSCCSPGESLIPTNRPPMTYINILYLIELSSPLSLPSNCVATADSMCQPPHDL